MVGWASGRRSVGLCLLIPRAAPAPLKTAVVPSLVSTHCLKAEASHSQLCYTVSANFLHKFICCYLPKTLELMEAMIIFLPSWAESRGEQGCRAERSSVWGSHRPGSTSQLWHILAASIWANCLISCSLHFLLPRETEQWDNVKKKKMRCYLCPVQSEVYSLFRYRLFIICIISQYILFSWSSDQLL